MVDKSNKEEQSNMGSNYGSTENLEEMAKPQQSAETSDSNDDENEKPTFCQRLIDFYFQYEFLCLIVVAILLARAYPPLGATYLAPRITATWIAVVFIFVLAGLGLKTEEFKKAFQRIYFNAFVQIFNFGVVSSVAFGFSHLWVAVGALSRSLADGMIICCCLPLTINMVLVLTKNSGGDEAAAIFNAAFGNIVGVFLSPVLILGYLGVTGDVDLTTTFYKLALRVVLPIIVGQILQKFSRPVVEFVKRYKKHFKRAQTYALVFIIYTVFSRTFSSNDNASNVGDVFLMILFQFINLSLVMVLAWFGLRLFFANEPTLRVMGLYGCTHKTVAMGVPLINAIYENDPNVGLFTLPLLVYHPMQLVIGSLLSPRLSRWVEAEKERLGIVDQNNQDPEKTQDEEQGPSSEEEQVVSTDSSIQTGKDQDGKTDQ